MALERKTRAILEDETADTSSRKLKKILDVARMAADTLQEPDRPRKERPRIKPKRTVMHQRRQGSR